MKTQFELGPLMQHLPTDVRDSVFHQAKDEGQDVDKLFLQRRGFSQKAKTNQLDPNSRTAIKYVSARTMDRDDEIVMPGGINTKDFMKYGHVLWGHNYSLPPIGSDEWIKADEFGLQAKTVYADTGERTMANILWHLVQQGHQKASSIGFVPLTSTQPGHNDFDKVVAKLESEWPEVAKIKDKIKRIFTKVVLLEHSDVSVPANVDAEMLQVAKGYGADDAILKTLGFEEIKFVPPEGFKDWADFIAQTEECNNQKPYPNEHAARLKDPGRYDKFRRQNNKFSPGVHGIFGITEGGKAELQSIRFAEEVFSVEQAKTWLRDNEYKTILFEPAIGKGASHSIGDEVTDSEGRKYTITSIIEEKETFNCSCIECDYKMTSEKHCNTIKCPKCGGQMRRAERPGPGQREAGEGEEKNIISHKETPLAPVSTEWDGSEEIASASTDDLKNACAWHDKDNADMKSSYKLVHHRSVGQHQLVWRGLTFAMGALLGARGGVTIPAGDKSEVYNHLAEHYEEFGQKPPELKDYLQGELKQMFPEMYDVEETKGTTRSVRVIEPVIRVVSDVVHQSAEEVSAKAVEDAFAKLKGKV